MTTRARVTRVMIADANQMACRLLSEALSREPGLAVVGSAADYESFVRTAQSAKPDVALLSAGLPGGPVKTNPGQPHERRIPPPTPWIALLDASEPRVVVAAFRAGAKGVFSRTQADIQLLAKCIRRVMEGQVWVDSHQMSYLLDALTGSQNGDSCGNTPKLTRREESVVRLVVQGMVNREIAEKLGLSEHTIKNYMFRIFDKLGVSNRVELALYAVARLKLDDGVAA